MKYAQPAIAIAIAIAAFCLPTTGQAQPAPSKPGPSAKAAAAPVPAKPSEAKVAPQDRRAKAIETMSNMQKKQAETQSTVTGNLK